MCLILNFPPQPPSDNSVQNKYNVFWVLIPDTCQYEISTDCQLRSVCSELHSMFNLYTLGTTDTYFVQEQKGIGLVSQWRFLTTDSCRYNRGAENHRWVFTIKEAIKIISFIYMCVEAENKNKKDVIYLHS